jgi:hypothetical protein
MTKLSLGRLLLIGVVALVVAVPLASAHGTGGTAPDGRSVTDGQRSDWPRAQPGTPAGPAHWNNSTAYWHDARWNESTARWNGSSSYGAHPMYGGPGTYGAHPMYGGPGTYGAHPMYGGPGTYGAHPMYGPRSAHSGPGARGPAWWTNATTPGSIDVPGNWWDGPARADSPRDRPVRPGPRGHHRGCHG